ncbi:MAG: TraR/DksA C4-type zinc finger protein [Xanthomonadaceae bacterium]|nr:TraR/DksA C4-type zinc finger protein [Xanthomonadaceae bacterium]
MIDDAEMAAHIDALAMERFESSRVVPNVAAPLQPLSCIGCGVDIPAERLRAVPSAKRCVRCQAQLEH